MDEENLSHSKLIDFSQDIESNELLKKLHEKMNAHKDIDISDDEVNLED